MVASEHVRVAVFVDWQNVYQAARRAFGMATFGKQTWPNEYGNFSPYQLSRLLAAGNGRGAQGELVRVEVHRGLPSSSRDPVGFGANRRQSQAWMAENPSVVIPRLRPLRYPRDPSEPPVEKGVDVNIAIGVVEQVLTGGCDVAVLFSHDTDLLPAVEAVARLKGPASIETASWTSPLFHSRLRTKVRGIHHHQISQAVFERVETRVNYARGT
jgi:uncharacterized LabA/DUF88 family protein